MNKLLLPLCLLGAALSTANTLFFSASTCPTEIKTMASVSDTALARAKDASPTPAKSSPARAAAATAAARDQTGSLGNPLANSTPGQGTNFEVKPTELAKWAVVLLAAKAHSGPSVSAPTIRYYRIGTQLRVVDRQRGWIKVADPISAQQGWIYEKYLSSKGGESYPDRARQTVYPDGRKAAEITWIEMAPRLSPKLWICHSGISQMVSDIVPRFTSALGQKSTRERAFELVQLGARSGDRANSRPVLTVGLMFDRFGRRETVECAFPTYAA